MMDDWTSWLFVAFVVLAIALVVYVRVDRRRKARAGAQRFANQWGFREIRGNEVFDERQRAELEFLKRGYGAKTTNAWEGMYKGEMFRVFDYGYTFGVPLVAHIRYWQTVVSLEWRGPELPVFAMAPRFQIDRGLRMLKWRKVESAATEFFRRNRMISPQPEPMKAIVDSGFGRFLDTLPKKSQVTVESGGGRLVLFRKRLMYAGDSWTVLLEEALRFAGALRGEWTAGASAVR